MKDMYEKQIKLMELEFLVFFWIHIIQDTHLNIYFKRKNKDPMIGDSNHNIEEVKQ